VALLENATLKLLSLHHVDLGVCHCHAPVPGGVHDAALLPGDGAAAGDVDGPAQLDLDGAAPVGARGLAPLPGGSRAP
jgi:hypothetical protein